MTKISSYKEAFHRLRNCLADMDCAIIGWRKGLAFNNEVEVVDELERMIKRALEESGKPEGYVLPKLCPEGGEHKWTAECEKCEMKIYHNPDIPAI